MNKLISVILIVICMSVFVPRALAVNVFGGAASVVINCVNDVIWTKVGQPRGGDYIWAPGVTRTYEYGPPRHSGQWLLGLYGAPFFCQVPVPGLLIFAGLLMTMLGSSK